MRPIFVSYRREDAEGEAGRLFDDLVARFGEDSVFLDVAAIEVGRDFRKAIDDSVSTCGVLLAIIGKGWCDAKNELGERRLDDPSDFVRLETASALKRDIPVIPVLVHGAKMPRADQLPDDLKELAYRNGVELTHARWRSDLELLIRALSPYADPKPITPTPPPTPSRKLDETAISPEPSRKSSRTMLAAALGAIVLAAGAYLLWPNQKTVPDLTGITLSDAEFQIKATSLVVGSKVYQTDSDKTPDTVLSQTPLPNARVKSGTAVNLVVVKQPALVEVPSLKGKPLADAQKALQSMNLAVGQVTREPDTSIPPDAVLSQFPNAGKKVDPGTAIDLALAQIPPAVPPPVQANPQRAVPDLTGNNLSDAMLKLKAASLTVGKISRQQNASVAQDTVLSEFPIPGRKVDPGTAVDLVVAQMPPIAVAAPLPPKGLQTKVPRSLPNFAGTWQLFAVTSNGVPQTVNPQIKPIVITQNGTTVTIFNRDLQINPAGIAEYQLFFANDPGNKRGHEVATAAQADLVDTITWRFEGATLVSQATSDFKNQYVSHPPGREVSTRSYRRVP